MLELDTQELERLRAKRPNNQKISPIWAKRVHPQQQRKTPRKRRLINNNENAAETEGMEEEEEEEEGQKVGEEEEEGDSAEEMDMDVEDESLAIRDDKTQDTQVGQPIGVAMGQRLEFFSQQMSARHKPATTRQYSQPLGVWKVLFCFLC